MSSRTAKFTRPAKRPGSKTTDSSRPRQLSNREEVVLAGLRSIFDSVTMATRACSELAMSSHLHQTVRRPLMDLIASLGGDL